MAMTKAEREKLERAELEVRIARALRFPTDQKPKPMTVAEINVARVHEGKASYGGAEKVARGWFYNAHSMQVSRGCSNGVHHTRNGDTTNTQTAGCMFRTKSEALRAMRHDKAREVAETLAKIDRMLEDAEAEEAAQPASDAALAFQRGQETARAACIAVAANYIAAARAHCKPGKADAQIGAAEEIIELLSARAD